MVRDTSIAANSEDRSRLRDRVVQTMGNDIWTRREIADEMGMQASTMSGAINKLIKEGRVEEMGRAMTCEVTGRIVHGIRRRR